jgi:BlaI family penicillinase repressor
LENLLVRKPTNDVTETELAMLQVLWDRGEATRRQVADTLYPDGGEAHYATAQTLLQRLEVKGFVSHERRDNVLFYRARVDREAFIGRRLQALADALCGGAAAPLVMNLVRSQPLSRDEVEELYAFLSEKRSELPPRGLT